MNTWRVHLGDVRTVLAELPAQSAQVCVTSPPYFGLRDYGHAGQIGLEATPDAYVAELVAVFREVRRVLRDDGTLWLVIGDSYANDTKWGGSSGGKHVEALHGQSTGLGRGKRFTGLKSKDLIGIPWLVAFALRADGWYLRSDIIWAKPNPMPESVTDRPTKSHEYVFLLAKSARYHYDVDAIREAPAESSFIRWGEDPYTKRRPDGQPTHAQIGGENTCGINPSGRNKRSVWTVATQPYSGAHFATFPEDLIEPCILAGSRPGDTVLDPFTGSGTTGAVAVRHQRDFVGVELNPEYLALARERIGSVAPMFAQEVA